MGTFYNSNISTNRLVLCLDAANPRSYPGSGNTWYDLSGYGHNVVKDSIYSPSFNENGYFSFTGGQNFETQLANISFSSEITMICWYKQTGAGLGAPRLLEMNISTENSSPANGHAIVVDTDYAVRGWVDTQGTVSARIESLDSELALAANTWRMLSYTYAGTSGSSKMYYNGTAQNLTRTSPLASSSLDNISIITIGAISDYKTYQHNQNYFVGDISMCYVYNKALSPQEINQNFNATRGRYGI